MDEVIQYASLGASIATILTLIWAVLSFQRSARLRHYTELDRLYFDIVALRIAHIHLSCPPRVDLPDRAKMTREQLQFDAYALLIWNFIETIYDRCKEADLLETWKPILDAEGDLHAKWFSLNLKKFKPKFRRWASAEIRGVGEFVDPDGHLRATAKD